MGVKEGGLWVELSRQGSKKDMGKYVLCRVSCVRILARSSCTIPMQKFEVGEMYIVGRPTSFFPYEL